MLAWDGAEDASPGELVVGRSTWNYYEDVDRFLEVFSTKGADKRGSHGSQGATVYRDQIEEDRVWAVFDWDEDGWTAFATDPETPGIMQEAGHLGRPNLGQYLGSFNA